MLYRCSCSHQPNLSFCPGRSFPARSVLCNTALRMPLAVLSPPQRQSGSLCRFSAHCFGSLNYTGLPPAEYLLKINMCV